MASPLRAPLLRILLCLGLLAGGTSALAAGPPPPAPGHRPATRSWVNHDDDAWAGWDTTTNAGFAANPAGCDPIDPAQCLLPFPNDWFSVADPSSLTGRRVHLDVAAMPRNIAGKPIDPTAWNAGDGFSAGSPILTVVPGMTSNRDLAPSRLPSITDLAMNDAPDLGVILLDADTGRVWPVWVEVDQYTQEDGLLPAGAAGSVQQDLMIHPARNLLDGHRYIVALRHLVTDHGSVAQPSAAFAAYRDGTAPATDARAAHYRGIFADLREAGWRTANLYLAWDFTTASTRNVTGRLLAIRDAAFGALGQRLADSAAGRVTRGSAAPAFRIDAVTDYSAAQNPRIARQVTGTFTVPCYIGPTCSPPVKCGPVTGATPAGVLVDDCPSPGEFVVSPAQLYPRPAQVGTYTAGFICNVGRSAFDHRRLLRPVEYGHGLFGSDTEVNASPQQEMADRYGMVYCATDWFGMASADVPNAFLALSDLSLFPIIVDRVEQGELNFLYLQRLLVHPDGFASSPAFRYPDGRTFLDTRAVYYDGNSQGGIYGGTVCAVSIDVHRCVLGVPGMGYAILLPRSSDYVAAHPLTALDPTNPTGSFAYSNVFDAFYPDQAQRMLIIDLIQQLWDRADPDGYAAHLSSTAEGGLLPHTPDHRVLLQMAWGDHQVANITAEDEARTLGAATIAPALLASRLAGTNDPDGAFRYARGAPTWGLPVIGSFPYGGSALVIFDGGPAGAHSAYGTGPAPPSDVPNMAGNDPHEAPRRTCAAQQQKAAFLAVGGAVTEPVQSPVAAPPYFSGGWQGTCALP